MSSSQSLSSVAPDADFYGGLIDVVSDYLYLLSDESQKSFDMIDKADCEKSSKIKELGEQIERLMSELSELKPEEPERKQEEPEEDGLLTRE